jgi:hypothetical protein
MKPKWKNGMKYLGISLLLIAIPGSTFLLPFIFSKKTEDSKKSNRFLGV